MNSVGEREAAIAHMAESGETIAALRQHVQEIVDGAAFKGSHRSAQFLVYIVEKAIAGSFESLKERMIGMELFGRSPAYDTGEDAIVRVTASDVRKRLLQHYGRNGTASEFRIGVPLGSYIPEITRSSPSAPFHHNSLPALREVVALPPDLPSAAQSGLSVLHEQEPSALPVPALPNVQDPAGTTSRLNSGNRWIGIAAVLIALNLGLWAVASKHFSSRVDAATPVAVAPWSAFFDSARPTHLIASDPDIEGIQILTNHPISVSDYANRRFLPEPNTLSPAVISICKYILHGDKSATVDTAIATDIAEVARSYSKKIDVIGARDLQLSNLKTDDNFIFLGSPLSDPWSSIFKDQLDFWFVPSLDPNGKFSGVEQIRNFHPRPAEPSVYMPTAKGGATGESFAIVALVGNPDQSGQVLLLGGADREGTQAAGRLVTDLPRFSSALESCGLSPGQPVRHFEMLLRVDTMAGYATQFSVAACHLLPGPTTH